MLGSVRLPRDQLEVLAGNDMVHTRSKSGVSEGPLPSLDGATEEERSIPSILGHLGLTTERARVDTIESIRGGTSNRIYLCTLTDKQQMLVRFFGEASSEFVDRHREGLFFEALAARGLGPQLLGSFGKGRVEEYIPAPPLTAAQLRSPEVSVAIARKLRELHDLRDLPGHKDAQDALFNTLRKWHGLALSACGRAYRGVDVEGLGDEVTRLQRRLSAIDSPLVPCHNDLNHLNILRKEDGSLVLIDLEYACWSYRGFDLGNHFCEWATDFHQTTECHVMHFNRYPDVEQQRAFCRAYLRHSPSEIQHETGNGHGTVGMNGNGRHNGRRANGGRVEKKETTEHGETAESEEEDEEEMALIEALRHEANEFALASHLQWALWALVQSARSSIDFDFFAYGQQRLGQYLQGINAS